MIFDMDQEGQRALMERAKENAISVDDVLAQSAFEIYHTEIAIWGSLVYLVIALIAWHKKLASVMQWIAFNLFLLLIVLVWAGTYLLLVTVLVEIGVPNRGTVGFFAYALAAVFSIFASYYAGKYAHHWLDRLANRKYYNRQR